MPSCTCPGAYSLDWRISLIHSCIQSALNQGMQQEYPCGLSHFPGLTEQYRVRQTVVPQQRGSLSLSTMVEFPHILLHCSWSMHQQCPCLALHYSGLTWSNTEQGRVSCHGGKAQGALPLQHNAPTSPHTASGWPGAGQGFRKSGSIPCFTTGPLNNLRTLLHLCTSQFSHI